MKNTQDENTAELESTNTTDDAVAGVSRRQRTQLGWNRLGKQLHAVSHLRYLFWILAIYFQFKTMFLSTGQILLDNLNKTLLMYGIVMSFEGLRDSKTISQKKREEYRSHQTAFRWTIAVIFAGGLFSIAVGCYLFFLAYNNDLGWAITVFGLGMLALARQQYDRLVSATTAE